MTRPKAVPNNSPNNSAPYILLSDVLGYSEPEDVEFRINLAKVPVRVAPPTGAPQYRNLLDSLYDGQLDLIFMGNAEIDF